MTVELEFKPEQPRVWDPLFCPNWEKQLSNNKNDLLIRTLRKMERTSLRQERYAARRDNPYARKVENYVQPFSVRIAGMPVKPSQNIFSACSKLQRNPSLGTTTVATQDTNPLSFSKILDMVSSKEPISDSLFGSSIVNNTASNELSAHSSFASGLFVAPIGKPCDISSKSSEGIDMNV